MAAETVNQLRNLQLIELEILKEVQKVCRELDIPYYALGGTLLGAARHNGFIPWDDDIDIALVRQDYDLFMLNAASILPAYLELHDFSNPISAEHPSYICRLCDTRTIVEFGDAHEATRQAISIDVFPLDAMPDQGLAHQIQKYRILYSKMMIMFSMYEAGANQQRTNRPFHEKALMRFREITKIGANWDTQKLMANADRVLRKYTCGNEPYVVNAFGSYKFKEMFPIEWLGKGTELQFEDTLINCPVEYEQVLTQMYGDWKGLPPRNEQVPPHRISLVPNNSELS